MPLTDSRVLTDLVDSACHLLVFRVIASKLLGIAVRDHHALLIDDEAVAAFIYCYFLYGVLNLVQNDIKGYNALPVRKHLAGDLLQIFPYLFVIGCIILRHKPG